MTSASGARAAELTRELEASVGYVLRRAQLAVFADFIASQSGAVVRPGQFAVLLVIGMHAGLTQNQLCEALAIKRANLVAMLDEFESLGFVRRVPCSRDGRAKRLHLSTAGAKVLSQAVDAQKRHEARITAALGAIGRRQLIDLLNRLRTLPAS